MYLILSIRNVDAEIRRLESIIQAMTLELSSLTRGEGAGWLSPAMAEDTAKAGVRT